LLLQLERWSTAYGEILGHWERYSEASEKKSSSKVILPIGDLDLHLIHSCLCHRRVHIPNCISIGLAVFARANGHYRQATAIYSRYRAVYGECAKTAEPIEMLFGLRIRMDPRNHVLGGVHIGATLRIPLYRLCSPAMRPFCQIIIL